MIVIPPCQFYKVNRNADFCFMKNFLSWMVLLMVLSNAYGQHPYCSKYKLVTKANRLIIEDLRSDSLDIVHVKLIMDMTDVVNQQISASAELSVVSKTDGLESIDIDLEGLTVDSVAGPNVTSFEQMSASVRCNWIPYQWMKHQPSAFTIVVHLCKMHRAGVGFISVETLVGILALASKMTHIAMAVYGILVLIISLKRQLTNLK